MEDQSEPKIQQFSYEYEDELTQRKEVQQFQQLSPIIEQSAENNKYNTAEKPPALKPSNDKILQDQMQSSQGFRDQKIINAYGQYNPLSSNSLRTTYRGTQSMSSFKQAEQFDRKVVHDHINRSSTKQLYTFPKASRFSKPKTSYCSTQFYENQLQNQFNNRSTALGYGTKSDFTKGDKWKPGPTTYDLKSFVEIQSDGSKGVKFGFGREELAKQGLLGNINKNPGPGTYQPKFLKTQSGYSLGERTKAKHIYLTSTTPPPTAYNIKGIHPKGEYVLGKYRGSCASVFSPTSSILNQKPRPNRVPGPGTYDPPGNIKDANEHMPSNYNNQAGWHFGVESRDMKISHLRTPGPGSYAIPSEFGDWEYPPLPQPRGNTSQYMTNKVVDGSRISKKDLMSKTDGFPPSLPRHLQKTSLPTSRENQIQLKAQ